MKRLESQLKHLAQDASPRNDFKAALWSQLDAEFEQTYPAAVIMWRRAFAIPLAVMVVLISTGAGAYAYASPTVTQEHTLWPVKRGIESVEGVWPRKPESAAQFHARMMERRLAEGVYMHHRQMLHAGVLEMVSAEFEQALTEMEALDEHVEVRIVIFEQIERQTDDYSDLIHAIINENYEEAARHQDRIRNNFDGFRVQITESTLDDDEKAELLHRLDFERQAPRSFELEFVQ